MLLRENQSLSPDFIDMLSAFSAEKVEYLLISGYALGYHGYGRSTGDIDLSVRRDEDNSERVFRALGRFGAPLGSLTSSDFSVKDTVYQIGVPPNRIDVVTDIDGVIFDDAWPKRKYQEVEGLNVPIIGMIELLANKRASGRPKDLNDILWLERNI